MKLRFAVFFLLVIGCIQFTFAQRKGYWQQKVDYQMHIDVNEKNYQYNGNMTLKYSNNSGQSLSKVYFHLYFNAFQPGSMMDYRLSNIADPDSRMATNEGSKKKPKWVSRIAELKPEQTGYQRIESLKYNGRDVSFKVDGTILEVSLPTPIGQGEEAQFDMIWWAQVPEQIRRSGRNSQ
ncbi:MAG TPA: M1 family peptidase, partial [Sphingobacterium sp.]|nr:M1 family peptidase [Sphingobacterium sp.]